MNIHVASTLSDPNKKLYEIVERKGIGHPDTLADGIAESVSNAFSTYTLQKYGAILNHWIDKTLITGALGEIDYGKGELKTKIKLYIFGKMSKSFNGDDIELMPIIETAVQNFMNIALPLLNVATDLEIILAQNDYSKNPRWMNPVSLDDLPNRLEPRANDTSVGIGFWPLSNTENLALKLEAFFYNDDLSPRFPYIGQDIKVMVNRMGSKIDVTMCVPFISRLVPDEQFYLDAKSRIYNEIIEYGQSILGNTMELNITINNNDHLNKDDRNKRKGYYFLVLGSALDDGEVGVVGRGNAASGVISCMRTSSAEAPAGKNPVYHVGKVYTYLAYKIAKQIGEKFDCHALVAITSKMGNELCNPGSVVIELTKDIDKKDIDSIVISVFDKKIWSDEIIDTKFFVPTIGGLKV